MEHRLIRYSIVIVVFFISHGFAQQARTPLDGDYDSWIKLEVSEAFVSRQSYIDFRDNFSGAEFGWHVSINGVRVSRGNRLYSTMYYPSIDGSSVRLLLVELDAFSDDIVSGADLKNEVDRYEMNKNGDWVLIRRSPFQPDANSGPDARPAGARFLKADVNDSVSFLDGDCTDYYRIARKSLALVVSAQIPLSVPDTSLIVYPRLRGMKSAQLISAGDSEGVFRLRSLTGFGIQHYRILFTGNASEGGAMLDKAIAYLETTARLPSIFTASDIAHIFVEYDHETARTKCQAIDARARKSEHLTEFCTIINEGKK
ncbi:MAG: hypothetical protein E4G96_09545 [Chrysiogenales bacterium]|nr:MAG: hypothetical protein E4G96_09545 [Chrysiogenales bacterium]